MNVTPRQTTYRAETCANFPADVQLDMLCMQRLQDSPGEVTRMVVSGGASTNRQRGPEWRIPAGCPIAVHSFAAAQVLSDHVERVQALIRSGRTSTEIDDQSRRLFASASARADSLSRQIRTALPAHVVRVFEDLDRSSAAPGQIASLPRVVWLLGALSALAAVRACFLLACSQYLRCDGTTGPMFLRLLEGVSAEAQSRWSVQCQEILRRNPWISAGATSVDLVDLESDRPCFQLLGNG